MSIEEIGDTRVRQTESLFEPPSFQQFGGFEDWKLVLSESGRYS
jgi:hypothetical protein